MKNGCQKGNVGTADYSSEAMETIVIDGRIVTLCYAPKENAVPLKRILDMMFGKVHLQFPGSDHNAA